MKQNTKQIIAICLLLSFAVSLVAAFPLSNAQTTTAKTTYAFISATPNPVGVGQETLLHIGISEPTNGTYFHWKGLTVTMIKPDGTTTTLGPFNTDATGGTGYAITPDQVGTYRLQTHFPQQKMVPGIFPPLKELTLQVTVEWLNLVVQQEPLTYFPAFPLPTEYWNRPINAQFYEWAPLTGQWLRPVGSYSMPPIGKYQDGNADAPETAHILWNTPYADWRHDWRRTRCDGL